MAEWTFGFVGADLKKLCDEAALLALKRHKATSTEKQTEMSISPTDLEQVSYLSVSILLLI